MPKALLDTGVWFGYFDKNEKLNRALRRIKPEIVKLKIKQSRVIRYSQSKK